jgi:O-antigen/teichoic acid export membrane protein
MFRVIYTIIGVIAGLIGVIFALNASNIFGATMSSGEIEKMRTMLLILSFNLFITFSFSIYNSIITASEKFIFQKTLAIINTIAKPLLMIPVLFLGYKSIALCVVITVVNVAVLLMNKFYCDKKLGVKVKFKGFDKSLLKIIFAYSFWIFLTQIVDKVNWSADQFILGAVSGTMAVSIYAAAAQLNTLFINLSTAISNVMLPKISKMVANKATSKELSDEFIKIGRLQFVVIFLAMSGLILIGKDFMKLWLGDGFDESYYVALLLVSPAVFSLIQNTGLSILQAMDKFKFKALATFIMAIFNIIISVFLAKQFGAIGAAIGTTIAIAFNMIIMNIYYVKKIRLEIVRFWKNIAGIFVKYVPAIAVIVVLKTALNLDGAKAVLLYGLIYTIM